MDNVQPQNQQRFSEFQQLTGELIQRRTAIQNDIEQTRQQLAQMEQELEATEKAILLHQGGQATIEGLTKGQFAIVPWPQPIPLNEFQAAQQAQAMQQAQQVVQQAYPQQAQPPQQPQNQPVAPVMPTQPPQQQPQIQQTQNYPQPPTAQPLLHQQPITPQAQQTFAPPQQAIPGGTPGAMQGPEMVQGEPPAQTE